MILLIGHVEAVYCYPVKSMRGQKMPEAEIGWYGVSGDRRFAFVRSGNTAGFPWLTGREVPELVIYTPRYVNPGNPKESDVRVITPEGDELSITDPALMDRLAQAYRHPIHLTALNKGCHDAALMSLISTATIRALGAEAGRDDLEARRFRPNILTRLVKDIPFGEEAWIGRLVQFGEGDHAPQVQLNRKNVRCAMTNIDPDTAERDPRVLKAIVQTRSECAGLYGSVQRIGRVCEGDPIYVIEE